MRFIKKALGLPLPAALAVAVSAGTLVVLTLTDRFAHPAVRYFSFLYSAYALMVAVYGALSRRGWKADMGERIAQVYEKYPKLVPLTILLMDAESRTEILLVPSLILNLAFGALKLITGLALRSWWLITVGLYYVALGRMRFQLLRRFFKRDAETAHDDALRAYQRTALQILLLTAIMAGMFVQMIWRHEAYSYPGVLIYAFALIAFVKISLALSSLIRRRKNDNLLVSAARSISFLCALVSMQVLQSAMLSRFGGGERFTLLANALFGSCTLLLMMILGLRMLYKAHKLRRTA